ncbi:MAG: arylsulfotransferase family protein [Azospirillaceae bacterium]
MRDRVAVAGVILSLVFLSAVGGSMAAILNVFPFPLTFDAYRGVVALYQAATAGDDPTAGNAWAPARDDTPGVVAHAPGLTAGGYTLFTSGVGPSAWLVDMDGSLRHSWHLPVAAVWDEAWDARSPHAGPPPPERVHWRRAHVFPNGDLLAIYYVAGRTPWGLGLVKVDRDSRLLWSYPGAVHHDLEVAPDGRIFTLTQEILTEPRPGFEALGAPLIVDHVTILSPDGAEVERIPLIDAFADSPFAEALVLLQSDRTSLAAGDVMHANAIDVLDRAEAAVLPFAEPGQILLSLRSIDALALLDPRQRRITWMMTGSWRRQHDPDILPDGRILLFDNRGGLAGGATSRVVEIDPATGGVVWAYDGEPDRPLWSAIRSAQERLANGNTLITESDAGRILEVTRTGAIAWDFRSPFRRTGRDGAPYTAVLEFAQRIDPARLDFPLAEPGALAFPIAGSALP